ncbi:MAG: hypothetical protein SFH39_11795 [Candidatus Magnetobacterium sp. LHC-1]|nr:hypothetical protein [Nitrospirota bacterium]
MIGTVNYTANNNDDIWIFLHVKTLKGRWWPQPIATVKGNNWQAIATVGIPRNIGEEFEIAVATFNKENSDMLHKYFEKADRIGQYPYIKFPDSTSTPYIVTVKKNIP